MSRISSLTPVKELYILLDGMWAMVLAASTSAPACASQVVQCAHLDVLAILYHCGRFSSFRDGRLDLHVPNLGLVRCKDIIDLGILGLRLRVPIVTSATT